MMWRDVQNDFGALTVALLLGMVLTRVAFLRRRGVTAVRFGETDKTDFLIPPFALFYVYEILAAAFRWPTVGHALLFDSPWVAWLGALSCLSALVLMLWSLFSFGSSFRVGIDTERPDKLVTTGIFALTRNPIYVAFGLVLLGEFLILPNWVRLIYLLAGLALLHRQVTREEAYLISHYGDEYRAYSTHVRRYL